MSTTFIADHSGLVSSNGLQSDPHAWLAPMGLGEIVVSPIAYGLVPIDGCEDAFAAYRSFRELVYIDEAGIIDLRDGEAATDFDEDDLRSIHLAAIERTADGGCVVGSMRLILRGTREPDTLAGAGLEMTNAPLPVEKEFGIEAAVDDPAPTISCEISRYISRHDIKKQKVAVSAALHQVAVATVTEHRIGPTYAIVERWLDRILRISRVPLTQLSEPRWIERYGSSNYAVEIHMYELAEKFGTVRQTVVIDAPRPSLLA